MLPMVQGNLPVINSPEQYNMLDGNQTDKDAGESCLSGMNIVAGELVTQRLQQVLAGMTEIG